MACARLPAAFHCTKKEVRRSSNPIKRFYFIELYAQSCCVCVWLAPFYEQCNTLYNRKLNKKKHTKQHTHTYTLSDIVERKKKSTLDVHIIIETNKS